MSLGPDTTLSESWRIAMSPLDRRPIASWAADKITLPPSLTRRKFDASRSRHFIAPLEAIEADGVREVNIMAPPRSAKTLIYDVAVPWLLVNDSASILWIFHDDQAAKDHSERRAMPIIESVAEIFYLMPDSRHHKRTQDILLSNGLPFVLTGPAINQLQSRGYKVVICSEVWLYKAGLLGEARARVGDFEKLALSKFLCEAQGGREGDDWTAQHQSGEQNEWNVPCESCGHYMQTRFSAFRPDESRWGIVFESVKDDRRRHNKQRAIETLRFECEKCAHGHKFSAKLLAFWNERGRYEIIGQPNPKKKSYHWNDLITGAPWDVILEQWLDAEDEFALNRNRVPRETFIQKRLAESLTSSSIYGERRFERTPVELTEKWPEEVQRFCTIDMQHEGVFYVTIRAWAKGGKSRRLFRGMCHGVAEICKIVEDFTVPTFVSTKGQRSSVFLDAGDNAKGANGAYAHCIRQGWIALKGEGSRPNFVHKLAREKVTQRLWAPMALGDPFDGATHRVVLEQPYGIQGIPPGIAVLYVFATNPTCDRLQGLIDANQWEEPPRDESEEEKDYRRQMSSEVRDPRTGKWGEKHKQNHYWDCSKMQTIAAAMVGIF